MAAKKIGTLIDQAVKQKKKIEEAMIPINKMNKKLSDLREEILGKLNEEGLLSSKGKLGRVSKSKTSFVQIDDWDEALKSIRRMKAWDLIKRGVTAKSYNELRAQGKSVKGLSIGKSTVLTLISNK